MRLVSLKEFEYLGELRGPLVLVRGIWRTAEREVLERGIVSDPGDDIQAEPSTTEVVDRGGNLGHVIRVQERRVDRGHDANVLRVCCDEGRGRETVELKRAPRNTAGLARTAGVAVAEKEAVEAPALGRAGRVDEQPGGENASIVGPLTRHPLVVEPIGQKVCARIRRSRDMAN